MKGFAVVFSAGKCTISHGADLIAKVPQVGNAYHRQTVPAETALHVEMLEHTTWELWHARLGHTNKANMQRLASNGVEIPPPTDPE